MSGSGTYLYAITRPVDPSELTGVLGVGGVPVHAVQDGEFACIVSDVSLDEFGEEALHRNLDDLTWLERTAREHDAVVQAAARLTTTAPLRMATVCLDDRAVVDRLRQLGERAGRVLSRLDGRIEWGVKIFADAADPSSEETSAPLSGADYLRRRRESLERRDAAVATAAAAAESVYLQLSGSAVAGRRHRPQDRRLSGVDAEMLVNAAFLVDAARTAEFQAESDRVALEHPELQVVLTGPWPAYSFAALEED